MEPLQLPFESFYDIVNGNAIEKLFTQMIQAINKQGAMIQNLQTKLENASNYSSKSVSQDELLYKRLQQHQNAIDTSKFKDALPINDIVFNNYQSLQQIQTQMDKFTLKQDMDQRHSKLKAELNDRLSKIQYEVANSERVNSLQKSQRELTEQVGTCIAAVQGKAEKSSLSQLEASAHKLDLFADQYDTLVSDAVDLKNDFTVAKEKIASLDMRMENSQTAMAQVEHLLSRKIDADVVNMQYQELQTTFQGPAAKHRKEILDGMIKSYPVLAGRIKDVIIAQENTTQQLHTQHEQVSLKLKNVVHQIQNRVERIAHERSVHELRRELACKAWKMETQRTDANVKSLQDVSTELDKQVKLAIRFMHWFSKRGEAYEHNFQMVEKRLLTTPPLPGLDQSLSDATQMVREFDAPNVQLHD